MAATPSTKKSNAGSRSPASKKARNKATRPLRKAKTASPRTAFFMATGVILPEATARSWRLESSAPFSKSPQSFAQLDRICNKMTVTKMEEKTTQNWVLSNSDCWTYPWLTAAPTKTHDAAKGSVRKREACIQSRTAMTRDQGNFGNF